MFFRGFQKRQAAHRWRLARIAAKALSYPQGLARMLDALGSGPGVLHVQWAHLPWLDRIAAQRLRSRGWAWVTTAHDLFPEQPFYPLLRPQLRSYYRSADAVVVHTKSLATDAIQLGVPRDRLHVIARGDLGVLRGAQISREEARSRLGLAHSGPLALFFGMIKPNKGLGILLEAWPRVMAEHSDARLLVAGEAVEDPSRYLRQIQNLGLTKSVEFRLGYIPDSEVGAYFQAADLLVLPHTGISLSGVASVGLGFGIPMVATRVGGIGDLVNEQDGATLVDPNSPSALASGMSATLNNLPQMQRRAELASERFRRENSWTETARKTMVLYRKVLEKAVSRDSRKG